MPKTPLEYNYYPALSDIMKGDTYYLNENNYDASHTSLDQTKALLIKVKAAINKGVRG